MKPPAGDERGFLRELIGDGVSLFEMTAAALLVSGAFAVFLSFRREFLPHDVAFLGMSARDLCAIADCRVVRFMFHDRVAFGGTLVAVATLYLWLAAFPLRQGFKWAWRAFLASGVLGFGSFLAYLGYGYLDTWHGAATLVLLPMYAVGLVMTRPLAAVHATGWLRSAEGRQASPSVRLGRWLLLATGASLVLAGAVIVYLGMTEVFVAEDLGFMGITRRVLDDVNVRLVPLIAHDRAGFGGGLATTGMLLLMSAWYAAPGRAFHQAVVIAGAAGFGCAIGTHFVEGYVNPMHLAPAFAGAALFAAGALCEIGGWRRTARAAGIDIMESGISGRGVFARRLFRRGETVFRWDTSRKIRRDEIESVSAEERHFLNPFDEEFFVVVAVPERYVNHSCANNTRVEQFTDVAIRDILPGEEITSDYRSGGAAIDFVCRCGAPNCRNR
jgi:SET domain-containing protein